MKRNKSGKVVTNIIDNMPSLVDEKATVKEYYQGEYSIVGDKSEDMAWFTRDQLKLIPNEKVNKKRKRP